MTKDRVEEMLQSLASPAVGPPLIDRLCELCATSLSVTGVGVSVTAGRGMQSAVASTDVISSRIEQMQELFGEGPCVDAVATGAPVLMDDLSWTSAEERWPAFTPAARSEGVGAAFAFPLQFGALRVGAMDLYRDRSGSLSREDVREARFFAEAAGRVILDLQSRAGEGKLPDALAPGWSTSSLVHQATGMIMVQLDADVTSAFTALRAHAYGADRSIQDVARDVVGRKLRLDGPR